MILPAPSELRAAEEQSEDRQPRTTRPHSVAAGKLPVPSTGHEASNGHDEAVLVSVPVPVDQLSGERHDSGDEGHQASQDDGRWTFGRLPAISVSDTAASADTDTCQSLDF